MRLNKNQQSIKLCYDARMIGHSGIGTQVFNVLKTFVKSPRLSLRLLGKPEQIKSLLPSFKGTATEFQTSIYSPLEQLKFPRPQKDELLHCPHYNAPIKFLKQSLVVVHDLIHLQSSEFAKPHFKFYAWFLLTMVTSRARHIVTVSDTTRLELVKRFPKAAGKTTVIYNGINHKLFYPQESKELKSFRKNYNLPTRFLLSVGIGKRHKNIDFIIKAMAPHWKSGKLKMPLVIAGTGGQLPDYVATILDENKLHDFIFVLPYLKESELPVMYSAAYAFIFPSLLEGFGFPMIEAMACGCPVIASNASCLPEIGADAAQYFDPKDANDFSKILLALTGKNSTALRQKMSKLGLKRARDFSWKKHTEQLIELYEQIKISD